MFDESVKDVSCKQTMGGVSRRAWLAGMAMGFGDLAWRGLMASQLKGQQHQSVVPRARRVIFLFMHGGPSSVDTFDYKPLLQRDHGKPLPFPKPRVQFAQTGALLASPWGWKQHGQSGAWASDLFPEVAALSDELTWVKSLHGSNEAHGGALLKIHTGSDTFVRPSMGSWVSYGLGSDNENLPTFIAMDPSGGHGGIRNYGAAFLPARHQGIKMTSRPGGAGLRLDNLSTEEWGREVTRQGLDWLQDMNADHLRDQGRQDQLEARMASFELAFRMQMEAPGVLDLSGESPATRKLYGLDDPKTRQFAAQCLTARRLAESGVRFIQCRHAYWDQHSTLKSRHESLAAEVDRPIAGLIRDLRSRGMLEDTLVMWGGEFGRTPTAQGKDGRDHNPHGFTWWFAGGGMKPGYTHGSTDDYGYYALQDKVHVHDLHATLLHVLGLDHEKLIYRHAGRDFRLTDIHGRVVESLLA